MLVLVGGAKSNTGKTTLVRLLLRAYPNHFSVIKITPKKEFGTGIETSREILNVKGSDTSYFLNEPSKKVFWVRGEKEDIKKALEKILSFEQEDFIVEGNSFLDFKKPDLFIFVLKEGETIKEQAKEIIKLADFIVINTELDYSECSEKSLTINLKKSLQDQKMINVYFQKILGNL